MESKRRWRSSFGTRSNHATATASATASATATAAASTLLLLLQVVLQTACDDCDFPATQGLSAPCCVSRGIDACGAGLVCAAFDGRTQATCYLEHSRQDGAECTADIQCSSGSCNTDFESCRSSPTTPCTLSLGCGGGPTDEPYRCAPSPTCIEEPCELRCLPCGPADAAACRASQLGDSNGTIGLPGRSGPADILFVIDNSNSMASTQDRLASAIQAFIAEAPAGADYRMAVISTDADPDTMEMGGVVTLEFTTEFPNEWMWSDRESACYPLGIDHGCLRGDIPARRIVSSGLSVDDQISAMAKNLVLGTCGSGMERGFDATMMALDEAQGRECSEGFLRADATLTIVFISDEEEHSSISIGRFASFLAALKPEGKAKLRVAAVIGAVDGVAANCRVGYSGKPEAECGSLCEEECPACSPELFSIGCKSCTLYATPDCCMGLAGTRYQELALMIGRMGSERDPNLVFNNCLGPPGQPAACLVESICTEDFSPIMRRIARDLVFW